MQFRLSFCPRQAIPSLTTSLSAQPRHQLTGEEEEQAERKEAVSEFTASVENLHTHH
jgi:hypothetical protein